MSKYILKIIKIKQENSNCITLICKRPVGFSFSLGECFILGVLGVDDTRIFSFSSSPTEDNLMLTFKKGITPFKKNLATLKIGDMLEIGLLGSQFMFDFLKPAVMIAGGIGITAFRSILKNCSDIKSTQNLYLLYVNHDYDFTFRSELVAFVDDLPHLKLCFHATSKLGYLKVKNLHDIDKLYESEIYLAGPPLMLDETLSLLSEIGIKDSQLHTESFDGYNEYQ